MVQIKPTTVIDKPTLVFVSGWGSGSEVWQALENVLALEFDIYHIDLMAFPGKSDAISSDSLLEFMHSNIPGGSIVVGWSLGGMLAVKLASEYPDKVRKLVLIATNMSFVETSAWPTAMSATTFLEFKKSFEESPLKTRKRFIGLQAHGDKKRKQVSKELEACGNLSAENSAHARKLLDVLGELELSGSVERLEQPALFLFGELDALVPSAAAERMVHFADEKMPDAQIDVVLIEGCGHVPHVSRVDQCLQHILRFLESQDPRYKRDKQKIARSFSNAAKTYNRHADMQRQVAEELLKIVVDIQGAVVDLGCGTGYCVDLVNQIHANAHPIVALDIAENMLHETEAAYAANVGDLHYVLADIEYLPFKPLSFDWCISSLAVQWCDDLERLFSGVKATLSNSGKFLFSTLSEGTLFELSESWSIADPTHVHVNRFTSTQEIIDVAETYGFELLHFEKKCKKLAYETVFDLMKDLKGIGAHNVNDGINKGFTSKKVLSALTDAYEVYRNVDGKLPATYEVEYWLMSKRRVI